MVKNPFELYPGGLKNAIKHFDTAYAWASKHPLCSLGDYAQEKASLIVDKDIFGEVFDTPQKLKSFAKELLLYKLEQLNTVDTESQ